LTKTILFDPADYADLSSADQALLQSGYVHAKEAIERNITPVGFSACSLDDNQVYGTDANYRSVWARDGAKTIIWTLDLDDEHIRECQRQTLHTILSHQAPAGQLPAHVLIDTNEPEYGGVGGITSIDSALWIIIAVYHYCRQTEDWTLADEYREVLQKAVDWLSGLDANNCGLLEIPEAGDWTDLFARSYHVLYDEVLWHRCLECFSEMHDHWNSAEQAAGYRKWSKHVKQVILRRFWPSTAIDEDTHLGPSFADVQYELGDARYLVAQISPFGYSWRCDVYGNLLAYLTGLSGKDRAMMTFRYLWGVGVNSQGPVRNMYPPIHAGDPEWRDYFAVNLLNLPNHYHNGGIWPFIGGLWVRFIHKLGLKDVARRELVNLANLCAQGVSFEWEFNEWHHAETGRPMGKAFQAWSAASFIKACHDLHVDPESITHF
jgi:GH15 family glucan-1,4-alpha-glucosidase